MALRAAFIGIDKHKDPAIRELSAAHRDSMALWALFCDTLPDIEAQLFTDDHATHIVVRTALQELLAGAVAEDTIIITFAGHGTRDHRLVLYDSAPTQLPNTTIEMNELGQYFKNSKAKAILCIIDCCFSGHAPARVFEESPLPRDPGDPLEQLAGKGRLLLAASRPNEPALEQAGHGLLTEALLYVLQNTSDPVDLMIAAGQVMERTRKNAARLGYTQTPMLYGQVEGGLSLPKLKPGRRFAQAFPEVKAVNVTPKIEELSAFRIPQTVLDEWQSRFTEGLNILQLEAVNTYRILDGQSLVVVAPTSSGKTFIGEMAAVRAHIDARK